MSQIHLFLDLSLQLAVHRVSPQTIRVPLISSFISSFGRCHVPTRASVAEGMRVEGVEVSTCRILHFGLISDDT